MDQRWRRSGREHRDVARLIRLRAGDVQHHRRDAVDGEPRSPQRLEQRVPTSAAGLAPTAGVEQSIRCDRGP